MNAMMSLILFSSLAFTITWQFAQFVLLIQVIKMIMIMIMFIMLGLLLFSFTLA